MNLITIIYIINATLLLLHEIESAYENEWEILKLPGKITGFIIIHIPIILILFYGVLEIEKNTNIGIILGIISGIGGILPFLIHKIIVKRKEHFNLVISNILIYFNILTGVGLIILSARFIA
jgi:hypothetical protein